jgi:hypothetical protein
MGCSIACKNRISSIIQQEFRNHVFNYGLVQEMGLILMLIYILGLQNGFRTLHIEADDWAIAISFAFFIIFYDEI